MKLVLSIAVGIVVGGSFLNASAGTPSQKQEPTAKSFQIPSKETVRELISGEWENDIGPNPSNMRITRNTIWNSPCWERYRILGVRTAKMNKADAYVVEIEVTSVGGPPTCGHSSKSSKPGFNLALISSDEALSGHIESINWMVCASKSDFDSALQY